MKKLVIPILLMLALTISACGTANSGTQYISIATASSGGTYYPIGVGIGNLWSETIDGLKATGQSSAGSVENVDLLRKNEADLAILQGLIGAQAYEGTGIFEDNSYKDLRSMAVLWPNVEHFVLMNNRVKTGTIEDIAGDSFSVGPQASGTEQSTLVIMQGIELTKEDITPEYLGYDDTISAMRDGRLSGGSLPAGTPVSAIMDMYASKVNASVLEVTDAQLDQINSLSNAWVRYVIPADTYPGESEEIHTIAQPNFIALSKEMDEDLVYELTKTMFENLEKVHEIHNSAKDVSLETALAGLPAPLHIGAYRYFEEQGVEIPEEIIPVEVKESQSE
ncbi:TAXI family TRAP transporter solute-binding subunit [Oceanobacillus profundus]|uniref:TAXI family TRAP transporter solute-binding subunit n=1 Tax=Oceanobacillus profundus TaxID=372463 RepID=A0A417YM50_9BACI|nr:TAXI family TRAP transporter solute-binding subunit [Oceanobacillus profundus]MCM3399190.1 TAXI family TRAP transporter solute-binding subunit [Oceanobacillus profundus]MDO6449222.1 TAXI family TRAP transporter solute-binding subunit [Oceanobacillus profundus]RHW34464.1 TAXI family TRAP transporter solute-binding subunit [Oceanobacillus profundus]